VAVTLNRPDSRNALNTELLERLRQVLVEVQDRPEDRVLTITGAGGHFCAGADLRSRSYPDLHPLERTRRINEVVLALHRLSKPTIALVRGVAVGAGMNLALGCDLVVATEDARFSQIYARRGLSIDFGGSWLLPRLVGLHRAKELALLADVITAAEAKELGLVNRVLPAPEAERLVAEWARRLAAGPPVALARTKRLLNDSSSRDMAQALDAEALAQVANLATADAGEAIAAFLAKRDPVFTGRSVLPPPGGTGGQ
jgi:Enoyl-CoA hydratase/carnithine racemase